MYLLEFGVIGCGQIGRRHVSAIQQEPKAQLNAVCDTDRSVRQKMRDALNDIAVYEDASELLGQSDISIVSICTPHDSHARLSIDAAEAGKHVLVEKPMALEIDDARKMIDAAAANDVKLIVVKQNRFNAPVQAVTEAIHAGRLGKIYMVQCNVMWNRYKGYYADSDWRGSLAHEKGGLHTQVSHFIDLLVWWLGPLTDARTITATLHHDIEIEDCGASALRFESGTVGSLAWTTAVYNVNFEGSITLIAEKGTIRIGGKYLNQIDSWDVESLPEPSLPADVDPPNDYGGYIGSSANHGRLFEEVVEHIVKARGGLVEGAEGLGTVAAIERIYAGRA